MRLDVARLPGWRGGFELCEMPPLVAQLILDEEAQRDRRVFVEHATRL